MSVTPATIYTSGPFNAYLAATNEKQLFVAKLAYLFLRFRASRIFNRPIKVLDLGCGNGVTSQLIMKMLSERGQKFHYFGVDPHQAQLNQFAGTVSAVGGSQLSLLQCDLAGFDTSESFDLVIAYHLLYHVPDLTAALRKILGLGQEVLIGHHGRRGIHQVQERFREYVRGGPHTISTDSEVETILTKLGAEIGQRQIERHGFVASIDVNSCLQGEVGRDLTAFFLQCDPALLEETMLADVGHYLAKTCSPPGFHLSHDVGLFTVTDLTHPRL